MNLHITTDDSKLFHRDRTQSHISIWRKVSKSYLQIIYFSTPYRSKVTSILWYVDPCRSKVTFVFFFLRLIPCRSKVLAIPYFYVVCQRIQSRIHTLLFISCWRKVSKSYLHTLLLCSCAKGLNVVSTLYFSIRVREDLKSYPHFTFQLLREKELKVESLHFIFQQFYFLVFGERT